MAVNGAQLTIVGNATRDPELRFSNSGMAVASFSVAVNFRKMNRSTNEWEEEEPSFFRVSCFGDMAENVAETITKGSRVVVVGRVRIREYDTQDGERRTSVEISADEVAPSLRWATAEVNRTERRGGDGGSRSGGGGGGGRSGGSGGGGGGGFDDDEEPF